MACKTSVKLAAAKTVIVVVALEQGVLSTRVHKKNTNLKIILPLRFSQETSLTKTFTKVEKKRSYEDW